MSCGQLYTIGTVARVRQTSVAVSRPDGMLFFFLPDILDFIPRRWGSILQLVYNPIPTSQITSVHLIPPASNVSNSPLHTRPQAPLEPNQRKKVTVPSSQEQQPEEHAKQQPEGTVENEEKCWMK